jgi:hypothetical protein
MVKLGKTWADLEATPRGVSWRAIRSLRADPPGHACGNRQPTFTTALEQAEQLFTAAASTGPAARPLPLFYGLSQAGRAVAAARTSGDPWTFRGHGISEAASANQNTTTVADFRIEPHKSGGAFNAVAAALNSSTLPGPTRLGDLWPLIPDTSRFELPAAGPHQLLNIQVNHFNDSNSPINAEISNLPASLGVVRNPDDDPSAPRPDWAEEEQRVRDHLAKYPTLAGFQFGTGGGQPIGFRPHDNGTATVPVHWPANATGTATRDEFKHHVGVTYGGHTNVYPAIDGTNRQLHPLTTWWALLFGLSILARYEPETWGRAIDISTSAEAVAVEHLLHAALDALPELLYRVLVEDA